MLPRTIVTDVSSRQDLTEGFVSAVALDLVRDQAPGAKDDLSLAAYATAREDHFRVAVSTRLYAVYDWLEKWGATLATSLRDTGIPALIYPEIALPEIDGDYSQPASVHQRGWVRIVIPFETVFVRQPDGSVFREPAGAARERILNDVRLVAPTARPAPQKVGPPKNEAHLHLDPTEYEAVATRLPIHLLDA